VGDAFGECFFSAPRECLRNRDLPPPPWVWTDDTQMAISIVETLRDHGRIQQDALAGAFAKRFMAEPYRGYGKGAFALLSRIARGDDWRSAAPELFGHGSYGNGCAPPRSAASSVGIQPRRFACSGRAGKSPLKIPCPSALWCAAHCLDDFEEALWRTVAGMGDRDTTCAIVGGIVPLSSREVPAAWIARREPLPEGFERA